MNVLLTGATGAIGKEIAKGIAARGDSLILACRSERKGKALSEEILAIGGIRPRLLPLDLSDSCSVRKAASALSDSRIDAIVNNAGVMNASLKIDADGHEDTVNVNYRNTRLLTHLLLPVINPGGCIVFTTSATRKWFPLQSTDKETPGPFGKYNRLWVYALSKKLITAYAASLARQLESRGIRVNCADPGVVDTPMLRMGAWYDRLTDIFFRPLCLKPETGAEAAIRALYSSGTNLIFTAAKGEKANKCSIHGI